MLGCFRDLWWSASGRTLSLLFEDCREVERKGIEHENNLDPNLRHKSQSTVFQVSKELLNNNIFDPLCNEFLDVYLPKCITLHVSPPEV